MKNQTIADNQPNKMKLPAPEICPAVSLTLGYIGGKWKPLILYYLFDGPRRFGQLHRAMPAVTQQMLTTQLRELERDGLVARTVYAEVPPRVEYALTEKGHSLRGILNLMHDWGAQNLAAQ